VTPRAPIRSWLATAAAVVVLVQCGCRQRSDISSTVDGGEPVFVPADAAVRPDVPVQDADFTFGVPEVGAERPPSACTRVTCTPAMGRYCGKIGDGCGGLLDCGACPTDQVCSGAPTAGLCVAGPNCVPVKCEQPTGKYCGKVGDGCGRTLDCGGCTAPDTCGGGSFPSVCGGGTTGCFNLCLKQATCPAGVKTVVRGTVLAPTPPKFGLPDPIYNAMVYVPNGKPEPFRPGISCDKCGAQATGLPLVAAFSGADGKFTLENVPAGNDIPLVIQLGRWRRQVVIPQVAPCGTTELPAELTRLPRNKAEGDIPLTAISTGKVDVLECVLRKIGIDEAEFTLPAGGGRVHLFQNNGAILGPATPKEGILTSSGAALAAYDMVILACEGSPRAKPVVDQELLAQYADTGGRVFLTHFNYTWMYKNPAWMGTATWNPEQARPPNPLTGIIDQSFPKGQAFARWLEIVMAQSAPGQIQIADPRHDLDAVIAPAQQWITSATPATIQHYTFNTPLTAAPDRQCGRALFSDFHVTDSRSSENVTFPAECQDTPLTPQEKVIEFMLFDLASCVQPELPPLPQPPPAAPPASPPPLPPPIP
jgi:hypothetical protein